MRTWAFRVAFPSRSLNVRTLLCARHFDTNYFWFYFLLLSSVSLPSLSPTLYIFLPDFLCDCVHSFTDWSVSAAAHFILSVRLNWRLTSCVRLIRCPSSFGFVSMHETCGVCIECVPFTYMAQRWSDGHQPVIVLESTPVRILRFDVRSNIIFMTLYSCASECCFGRRRGALCSR